MRILVTGGLGYIGLNTCLQLLQNNYDIVIVDNLSNSTLENLKLLPQSVPFYPIDIREPIKIREIFKSYKIDLVIHFASLKSVPESIKNSLIYYDNNIVGTIQLLKVMREFDCDRIIFSSSACVYGNNPIPYDENQTISMNSITSPYGKTKYIIEEILRDASLSYGLQCVVLRYFNPVGTLIPNISISKSISNLMDVILNSVKSNNQFFIYGRDYETKDGTCIRDFIHIYDLVMGHIKSIDYLYRKDKNHFEIFNLGSGNGITVLNMIQTFEKVNHLELNYEFTKRREGDVSISISNIDKAKNILNWCSVKMIDDMCKDSLTQ